MTHQFFKDDGDDDAAQNGQPEDGGTEAGDYDLGDSVGERIGEHEEDPSL